jgi:hypothetical protein
MKKRAVRNAFHRSLFCRNSMKPLCRGLINPKKRDAVASAKSEKIDYNSRGERKPKQTVWVMRFSIALSDLITRLQIASPH